MSNSEFTIEVVGRKAPRPERKTRVSVGPSSNGGARKLVVSLLGLVWLVVKPRRPTWVLGALAFVLVAYGTPHVLVSHNCAGVGTPGLRCYECRYLGMQGTRSHMGPNWNCPVIAMIPVNWGVLARQVGIR